MFAPRGWLSRGIHRTMYRTLSHSKLFDRSFYRVKNLNGLSRLQDPLWHFITAGWKEGFSPSERFDSAYYLAKNDDVRVAHLNPLYHYLEYGETERRLPVRSALEAQHIVTPEASPLRYFITPALGANRVSVLFDSATNLEAPDRLSSILEQASVKAREQSASLRILFRPNSLPFVDLGKAVKSTPLSVQETLEITEIPTTLTYSDIPFFAEEISIATSWSSASALQFSTLSEHAFLVDAANEALSLVGNDEETRRELRRRNASLPTRRSGEVVSHLSKSGPWLSTGIIAFVDVANYPLVYSVLIDAINQFLLTHRPESETVPVTLVGQPGERFAFAEEIYPTLLTHTELLQSSTSASCIVAISSSADDSVSALAASGFTVIHVGTDDSANLETGPDKSSHVLRTVLEAEAIADSLRKALSS